MPLGDWGARWSAGLAWQVVDIGISGRGLFSEGLWWGPVFGFSGCCTAPEFRLFVCFSFYMNYLRESTGGSTTCWNDGGSALLKVDRRRVLHGSDDFLMHVNVFVLSGFLR